MSESVPSSIASFAHRRPRHDSTVTFTYLTEDEDLAQDIEEAVEQDTDLEDDNLFDDRDGIESVASFGKRHRRSESHASAEHPLLDRHESAQSFLDRKKAGGRISQKIYIVTEDLTAVITGFCTSPWGFALYVFLCTISLGIGYLILHWIPKWRLRLIGAPAPLRDCRWVAIEVSWRIYQNRAYHNMS
jgi:cation-transporting P-type ATPase 13A2